MAFDKKCILCNKNKFKSLSRRGILEKGGPILMLNNVICKNCGLVFMSPQPSKSDYEKIYKEYENSRHNCKDKSEVLKVIEGFKDNKKGEEIYNFLKEYLQNEKKVLDIGCGFGHISNSLKNMNGCNVSAVEPSELLAKTVGEELEINVFNGQFDDFISRNNERFNILIMHHVFEHFTDPVEKLYQFKNLLLPNGVVYIEVPNVASFKKPVNHFFDYMHPFSYSPKTFKELVYKNGYKIVKVNKEKKYRLQVIIALESSPYRDIGNDKFWNRGAYPYTKLFVLKRKFVDLCH